MKKLIIIAALVSLFIEWHKHAGASNGSLFGKDPVVITFTTNEELIGKLRQVRTGQKIDLQPIVTVQPVSKGIRCSDAAERAAYAEEMNRKQDEEHHIIVAELARIHGVQ